MRRRRTVKSRWEGGTRTDHGVDIGGQKVDRQFQIQIDEPCELCGTNQYANPQEYLLAATNACMMVGYATVAAVMGVKLSKLELEITGDIDLRGFLDIDASVARGYERLHYTVRLAGDGTPEQFEKMLTNTDVVIGAVDQISGRLVAFARALTDGVFKAIIFDVIVAPDVRNRSLGTQIMNAVRENSQLHDVRQLELYCCLKWRHTLVGGTSRRISGISS